jgi:hypothetical protein
MMVKTMNDPEETDPRETLRRLVEALDEAPPDDDEARETVAALGIDLDALTSRLRARAAAYEAGATSSPVRRSPEGRPRQEVALPAPSFLAAPLARPLAAPRAAPPAASTRRRSTGPALAGALAACAAGAVALAIRSTGPPAPPIAAEPATALVTLEQPAPPTPTPSAPSAPSTPSPPQIGGSGSSAPSLAPSEAPPDAGAKRHRRKPGSSSTPR